MSRNWLLFLIIFLEGYAVLSAELLAIRQVVPYVGNSTDTVSMIIAAVLMPLAFGYYTGGRFKPGRRGTVRNRLLRNTALSAFILALGLSYFFLIIFFDTALGTGKFHDHTLLTALYCIVFLVFPIYMLGQTVPLISNYFGRQSLPRFAGKIMFLSTTGSFMGAVFCTLVLMPAVGVHNAVAVTIFCLTLLTVLLSRNVRNRYVALAGLAFFLAIVLNSNLVMHGLGIVSNNQYNTIEVRYSRDHSVRILAVNNSMASGLPNDPERATASSFPYIRYVDNNFINTRPISAPPMEILVIGAGGFTVGLKDNRNKYTFLDIDPAMKDVAETHFLHEPLTDNKEFVAKEARAFLAMTDRKFDLVFIDAYSNILSYPEHLVTREFFQQVRDVLTPDGVVVINAVQTPTFTDRFSARFNNTLRSVFPLVNRDMLGGYDGWTGSLACSNVMYVAFNRTVQENEIYTDNMNPSFYDIRSPVDTP